MVRNSLIQLLKTAVKILVEKNGFSADVEDLVEVEPPKQAEHGDFATNFCLVASKKLGQNPRALAGMLVEAIREADQSQLITEIDIAGPGFINFKLSATQVAAHIGTVLEKAKGFGKLENSSPERINVEFVSVNPNGPITIGSGRGAAFGSALCNVLEAAGNVVHREYYINDGVNSEQMRLFAESIRYQSLQALGVDSTRPDNGYFGDYVEKLAVRLLKNSQRTSVEIARSALRKAIESVISEISSLYDLKRESVENAYYHYLIEKNRSSLGRHIPQFAEVSANSLTFPQALSECLESARNAFPTHNLDLGVTSLSDLQSVLTKLGDKLNLDEIREMFPNFSLEVLDDIAVQERKLLAEINGLKNPIGIDFITRQAIFMMLYVFAAFINHLVSKANDIQGVSDTFDGKDRDIEFYYEWALKEYSRNYYLESFRCGVGIATKSSIQIAQANDLRKPSHEVANKLHGLLGSQLIQKPLSWFQGISQDMMLEAQRNDLDAFKVNFDTWFSEQSLHDGGAVQQELDHLIRSKVADDGPYRIKLDMAKGGVIKDVIREEQPVDEDDTEDSLPEDRGGIEGGVDNSGSSKTVWLRSTKFGDDQDRVLRRRDGRLTYIASDVAYHKDKFNRPADATKLITVLGPDHHGYIGRLTAVVAAMHADQAEPINNPEPLSEIEAKLYSSVEERNRCQASLAWAKEHLEVQIFQIVRFLKDGKPAPMRKRDGNIYALIDLVNEIGETIRPNGTEAEKQQAGSDVARFFYLMRHHDTAMDFDLELATKQSDENPVFYVQYAHARISSVIEKAKEQGFMLPPLPANGEGDRGGEVLRMASINPGLLNHPKEIALILKICDLPHEVERTANDYSVNRLTTYAIELARTYHSFYDSCRVIQSDQPELTLARLALCQATRIALKNALNLLGVSAPERMDRTVTN